MEATPPGLADAKRLIADYLTGARVPREQLEASMESVTHLMLAERPDYMERYVESMELPRLPRRDGVRPRVAASSEERALP